MSAGWGSVCVEVPSAEQALWSVGRCGVELLSVSQVVMMVGSWGVEVYCRLTNSDRHERRADRRQIFRREKSRRKTVWSRRERWYRGGKHESGMLPRQCMEGRGGNVGIAAENSECALSAKSEMLSRHCIRIAAETVCRRGEDKCETPSATRCCREHHGRTRRRQNVKCLPRQGVVVNNGTAEIRNSGRWK